MATQHPPVMLNLTCPRGESVTGLESGPKIVTLERRVTLY